MQMISVFSAYPESVKLPAIPLTLAESLVCVRCVAEWIVYRRSIRLTLRTYMVMPNG